jgi:hypothetical protein
MAYRPYPNADRARAQVQRGRRPQPPSEFQVRLAEQANAALEYAGRVIGPVVQGMREGLSRRPEEQPGLYVLSTRRQDAGSVIKTGESSAVWMDAASVRPWTREETAAWYRGEGSPRPGVVGGPS